jgi:heptosyltransferase-2
LQPVRPTAVLLTYTGIGDLLMALPLLGALRPRFRALPAVHAPLGPLADILREDGLIEGHLPFRRSLRFGRDPLGHVEAWRALRRLGPDVLLIYGKPVLGFAARLGLFRARRVLYGGLRGPAPRPGRAFEAIPPSGNQSRDYLRFAERLGVPAGPGRARLSAGTRAALARAAAPRAGGPEYAVVAPWTTDPRRQAPLSFFRDAIRIIADEGRLPVVVTGVPGDRPAARELIEGVGGTRVRSVVGETGLPEALGILAGARFVLSNDGGTLHLALLAGTRCIAAFGPTAPEERLLEPAEDVVALRVRLPCSPCADTARRYRCPGAPFACLREIRAADARPALLALCRGEPVSTA